MTADRSASMPAQKILVDRCISWEKLEERLDRYKAIDRAFPLALLKSRTNSPPYFCHYMSWRLGVWRNEALFERLDELLHRAETLPNWSKEQSLLESAEYADFWSLVWQLQVAEHLCSVAEDVRWCGSGPDLSAEVEGTTLFVECFAYRKSFGLRIFLDDILAQVGSDIKLDHDWFMPFSLPSGGERAEFLDRALRPFLDEPHLEQLRAEARQRYPLQVVAPGSSLVINLDGPDVAAYDASLDRRRTGDPEEYIDVILREAIKAKADRNQLRTHRPNLLAVSYLLSGEAQLAFDLREKRGPVDLGDNIDALAVSAIGIDERLSRDKLLLVKEGTTPNPALPTVAAASPSP